MIHNMTRDDNYNIREGKRKYKQHSKFGNVVGVLMAAHISKFTLHL
jgi:hypothetical protein